jgi:hypothetical protein
MEVEVMAPEREVAAQAKIAARMGAMAAVTRTEAVSDQSSEGTGTKWVWPSIRVARVAVGCVIAMVGEANTCRTRPGKRPA